MPDIKISELTAATGPSGTDVLPINEGGTTKKLTFTQLVTALLGMGVAPSLAAVNNQSNTTYTFTLNDNKGNVTRFTGSGAVTATVPTNAAVAFPIGSVITSRQVGTGRVTFTPSGGVTINVPTGSAAKTGRVGASVMLHKVATDEWDITGDLGTA